MPATRIIARDLLLTLVVVASFACAPPREQDDLQNIPELTREVIEDRINGARVYDVKPESGKGDPISWGFDPDEPKEITIVDQQTNGKTATVVLDIKTESAPYARTRRVLAGRMRTEWRLESEVVVRRWEIHRTENISITYKDLPASSPQNANGAPRE